MPSSKVNNLPNKSGEIPAPGPAADFVAADEQRLYYCGDFCSGRAPGFEAAALSALDAAAHIIGELCPPGAGSPGR